MIRQPGILLVGPTGSGKTPLGDRLQVCGLWGRCCHHFDFGAGLRDVASGQAASFTPDEVRYLRDVVDKGALLENDTFYLALRILDEFIARRRLQLQDLLVMNGLPRHLGQADAIAQHLDFIAIIHLQCGAETVWERLRLNSGGDRLERTDDDLMLVERKMAVYAERTQPLLSWYQQQGIPLIPISVAPHTQPPDILAVLERQVIGGRKL